MLALLQSHFIFFPLIKKDISYVTSPLCSYQHTCIQNTAKSRDKQKHTHTHTHARVHTPTHTVQLLSLQTVTQYAHVFLKRHKIQLYRISRQNSHEYNVPF